MTRILEARDLYRFYHAGDEETLALRGVSVTAEPGELIAVVGPSGSGKSTLLACIAGLDEPDGGVVDVAGERVSRRSESGAHGDPRSFDRDALPEWQPARPPQRRGQCPARTTARRPRRHRRRQCDPGECGPGRARPRSAGAALGRRARPRRARRGPGQRSAAPARRRADRRARLRHGRPDRLAAATALRRRLRRGCGDPQSPPGRCRAPQRSSSPTGGWCT